MWSYQTTGTWWTAPLTWRSQENTIHSNRGSTRAQTNGGVPAPITTRASSSTYLDRLGLSTASTSSTLSTRSGTGGVPVGGGASFTLSSTFGDTSSSSTGTAGSGSGSYTRSLALTATATSTGSAGQWSTTGTTLSSSRTRYWPSTLTVETTTGIFPATGTTSTRTCSTEVSATVTEDVSTSTAPTTGPEYTTANTYRSTSTTTTGTGATTTYGTTAISHAWLPLPATIVFADAAPFAGDLYQNALVWHPPGITADSALGLFTDFFSTLASGTAAATVDPFTSRISAASTVWRTWSLSTAQENYTETTTGTTSTATGTVLSTSVGSSLDGLAWNSTLTSSSTHFLGTLTASSTYTAPGPVTLTDYTFTRETTSHTDSSQFTRLTVTDTAAVPVSFSQTWQTWDRSYTTSSSFSYPLSTSTATTVHSWSTDGWLLGSATVSSQEWQTLTTSYSWTEWDGLTNALLIGGFTSSGSSGGGVNATTESHSATVAQTWGRTDHAEQSHLPLLAAQTLHEFTRFPRIRERLMPRGFLGFGDGFSDTSPVHAGLTSSLASGDADPAFSLIASVMPRHIARPAASIFATGPCWTEGSPFFWSSISATWLGSATGSRLTASLAHRWISTGTTVSGTSTLTLSSTKSATYVCGVTGSISGDFFSEYEPELYSTVTGIGRPDLLWLATQAGGGPAGGTPAVTSAAYSATFPPGALTLTWESGPGATTSSSFSTSTGELTFTLPSATNPVVFSYEEVLRFSWFRQTDLQLETASRHYLPVNPWTADLH